MDTSKIECPSCQTKGDLKVLPRWKHASQLAILLGGVVFPTLWIYGRKTKVTCNRCGKTFGFRTLAAKLSISLFWLLFSFMLLMLPLIYLMIN